MKAKSTQGFEIDRKYEKFPDLLIAHVWNVRSDREVEIFVGTHAENVAIGEALGWTKTASWAKGKYTTTKPSKELCTLLEPHRMTPEKWRARLGL